MAESRQNDCPDCSPSVNRRDFVKGVAASAAVVGTSSLFNAQLFAAPKDEEIARRAAHDLSFLQWKQRFYGANDK